MKRSVSVSCHVLHGRKDEEQSLRYYMGSFQVPYDSDSMEISVSWTSLKEAQLPMILFSPDGDIRIIKASEGTVGRHLETFFLSKGKCSSGAIPGNIGRGVWKFLLYKRRFDEDLEVKVDISLGNEIPDIGCESLSTTFDRKMVKNEPGWYEGELHVHSSESTGRTSVHEVVSTARERGLDFLAVTDHFAASHWGKLEEEGRLYDDILLLKSMEVSGDRGHANIHGLEEWILPLVDDNEEITAFLGLDERQSMSRISHLVHDCGGLMSINHALSGLVGWRYHDFDFRDADIFEVWCLADGVTSMMYPTMWDQLLREGVRLTGVGSSDSHDSRSEGFWKIGRIRNCVYAESLSREGILEGLRKGRCYAAIGNARMSFYAEYEGRRYEMGDEISYHGGKVELHIRIDADYNGNLFIYQDGNLNDVLRLLDDDRNRELTYVLESELEEDTRSEMYVRLEFHEETVEPRFFGMAYRDHETMRLISNPIYMVKDN